MNNSITLCKTCATEHSRQYCNNCGQKVFNGRFTFRRIFDNLVFVLLNVDRGLFHTLKELTFRPGKVVRDYLQGRTKIYFNPFSFLILAVTITVILNVGTGIYDQQLEQLNETMLADKNQEQLQVRATMQAYIKKFLNILILLMLPGIALMSFWVTHKKGYSLAEHFVVNCYYYGYTLFLSLLIIPFQIALYISPITFFNIGMILTTIYLAWAYKDWLGYTTFGALTRSTIIYTFGYIITIGAGIVLGLLMRFIL